MYDNENYQEVYFDQYCETCKHEELKEMSQPCIECLENPINFGSHKPVMWEEKERETAQKINKKSKGMSVGAFS